MYGPIMISLPAICLYVFITKVIISENIYWLNIFVKF